MADLDHITHEVRLGDCLDPVSGLASLPDKSVSHVLTDPPYSEHVHANGRRGSSLTRSGATPPSDNVSQRRELDFAHLTDDLRNGAAVEFARIVRRWVLVFTDLEGLAGWRESLIAAGLEYVRGGIWVREGCTPQFSGDRPAAACEAIVIAHPPGKKRWNAGGKRGVWTAPSVKGERHHTTEKPLDVMESLVRDFTDPGDLIVDAFCGSGTTGVACRRLGRRFIGIERDPKYHAIAEKRISAASEQMRLLPESGPEPKQESLLPAASSVEGRG